LHSLVRKSNGTVWAWGWNLTGQLGNGLLVDSRTPLQVNGVSGATGLAAGAYHSLVVRSDQTVVGRGWSGWGQLGPTALALSPVSVFSWQKATSVSAGIGHSVAVVTS
jgi:alpha-tubulin suppressor-like RCC1 family protein